MDKTFITKELSKSEKKALKEAFIKLANDLDKYKIGVEVEPIINEFINWNGKGTREIKYIRYIIVEDKEPIEEKIEKRIF